MRTVPRLCVIYPGIRLTRKITEKPLSGHPIGSRLRSAERDSFSRLGRHLAMALTSLLASTVLGFLVRLRGQPSVSVSICQIAELGGSPLQLTLSQMSHSGL